jgi:MEMO1 family protein
MSANFSSSSVRRPAVAGYFYPADPVELRDMVGSFLAQASAKHLPISSKAFIVPHAGYVYSGSTAADAYAELTSRRGIRKVVLIGPSHRVYLEGAAVPSARAFVTPLGTIDIDQEAKERLVRMPGVVESDAPHEPEHSLEVQLPFLQVALDEFTLIPIVLGNAAPAQVAAMLAAVSGDDETLVLASSDLSHYLSYRDAQRVDAETNSSIVNLEPTLTGEQACGAVAINGLLHFGRERGMRVREISRCNSGDTAGDRARVVGYGAYALHNDS